MDGTLFNSEGNARVMKGPNLVKVLTHGEYNTHQLEPGHHYDFSDFRSAKLFRRTAIPIDNVLNLTKSIVSTQGPESKTVILTARSNFDDHHEFMKTFKDHGFPIDKVDVELSGNLGKYMLGGAKPNITKAVVLKKYLSQGDYDEVKIWDDSKANLETLIKLSHQFDVKMTGYLVDPNTGHISKYNERTNLYEDLYIPKPEVTLNISRSQMPQIGADFQGFLDYLKSNHVTLKNKWVDPSTLKATQGDFDVDIVQSLMRSKSTKKLNPQVISSDNYILDGHHHWLSALNAEKREKIPVIQASVGILELLNLANRYPKVEKRSLEQSKNNIATIKNVLKNKKG